MTQILKTSEEIEFDRQIRIASKDANEYIRDCIISDILNDNKNYKKIFELKSKKKIANKVLAMQSELEKRYLEFINNILDSATNIMLQSNSVMSKREFFINMLKQVILELRKLKGIPSKHNTISDKIRQLEYNKTAYLSVIYFLAHRRIIESCLEELEN